MSRDASIAPGDRNHYRHPRFTGWGHPLPCRRLNVSLAVDASATPITEQQMDEGNDIHADGFWIYDGRLLTDDELALVVETAMTIDPGPLSSAAHTMCAEEAPPVVAADASPPATRWKQWLPRLTPAALLTTSE